MQIHAAQEAQIRIETQDPTAGQARHPPKSGSKISLPYPGGSLATHCPKLNEARSRPFSSRTGSNTESRGARKNWGVRVWDPDLLLLGDLLLELARLLPQRLHPSPSSPSRSTFALTPTHNCTNRRRPYSDGAALAPTRCRSKRSRPSVRRF